MNGDATIVLRTGRVLPVLGLGTWNLRHNTADIVAEALNLGYPMIDTSGDYGTQPGITEGLKKSSVDRDEIFIITKIEDTGTAYAEAEQNVGELGIDAADLILIHRPPENTDGVDLWKGLIKARQDGGLVILA